MSVGGDRYQFATVSIAGTSNIVDGPAVLHTITVSGVLDAATLTVKNGTAVTSATVAIIDSGTMATYRYDAELGSGLQVVTSGNVIATITYTTI